jgi:formylglycine-generating enzyme required for sulfatase activity
LCAGSFVAVLFIAAGLQADEAKLTAKADPPLVLPKAIPLAEAEASTAAEMKPYVEVIEHTDATIKMTPIPGGKFLMGSPESEKDRKADEGPQHEVEISPFWMSTTEITWNAYEVWMDDLDIAIRKIRKFPETERDKASEEYQLTQPTPPYVDMSFGMGKNNTPAISMTQLAARTFCNWLSTKTGRYYRLPTEAEWEYACRAGTTTAYSFGDDPALIDEYAWTSNNSDGKYQKVGRKKPNPWGLYDMHGNVAEWVLDGHSVDFYGAHAGQVVKNPLLIPTTEYNRVVRGGSWDYSPKWARSAARMASEEDWKSQDPQSPQSIWYLTDAQGVGFRIVRPLEVPSLEERAAKWDKHAPFQDRHEEHVIDQSLREE